MSDAHRDLHDDAYREWRDKRADEFAGIQRRAFKAGFEAAAAESQSFRHLRQWLEEQRDDAQEQVDGGSDREMEFARYLAFREVLTKLSEMGCRSEGDADE